MAEPARNLPEDDQPVIRPQLGVIPGGGEGDGVPQGKLRSVNHEDANGYPASQDELADAENNNLYNPGGDGGGESKKGVPGNALAEKESSSGSFGFDPGGDSESGVTKLRTFAAKNKKKGMAGGGMAVTVALVFILGIGGIASYALQTIAKDMLKFENKIEQHTEKYAAKKIAQKMICRQLPSGCNGDTDPEDNKATAIQQDNAAKAAGDEDALSEGIDTFDFTDPTVMSSLASQGIKVNIGADGEFEGLTDESTGNEITGSDLDDDALFSRFEAAEPEWNVGQVESYRPLAAEHAGSDWDPVLGEEGDDPAEEIRDSVSDGADGDTINTEVQAEDDQAAPTNDTTPEAAADYSDDQGVSGATGEALEATNKAVQAGESESQALAAGENAFSIDKGNVLLANTIASDGCSVDEAASEASKARVPEILKLEERHSSTLISLASQEAAGKITGKEVGEMMSLLDGDPTAPQTTSDGTTNEASAPFSSSSAWQDIEGGSMDTDSKSKGYAFPIDNSSLPEADSGTQIVNDINSILKESKVGSATCTLENSRFGSIAGGLVGAGQFFLSGFSLCTSEIAIIAANTALQETLQHVVIPEILKYFTPVGLDGVEDSVQWFSNSDAGTNIATNDYARRIGGEPLTQSQASTLAGAATDQTVALSKQESWTDRTFAISNPDSLVARLAVDLPLTRSGVLTDFSSYFSSIPKLLGNSFATIFTPSRAVAATSVSYPGQQYGVTQYGFTDADADKYDPIANEQFLSGFNPKGIISVMTKAHTIITAKRLDMLGDPTMFPNATDDPSTTDVLHCFTQTYDGSSPTADLNPSKGVPNDPICGSEGSYDYTADTPEPPANTEQPSGNNTVMTDTNVVVSYCDYLNNKASQQGTSVIACPAQVTPQMNDDITRFRQYILDVHVMDDYTSLTNNQ
jgi:hypothetical protein